MIIVFFLNVGKLNVCLLYLCNFFDFLFKGIIYEKFNGWIIVIVFWLWYEIIKKYNDNNFILSLKCIIVWKFLVFINVKKNYVFKKNWKYSKYYFFVWEF